MIANAFWPGMCELEKTRAVEVDLKQFAGGIAEDQHRASLTAIEHHLDFLATST